MRKKRTIIGLIDDKTDLYTLNLYSQKIDIYIYRQIRS